MSLLHVLFVAAISTIYGSCIPPFDVSVRIGEVIQSQRFVFDGLSNIKLQVDKFILSNDLSSDNKIVIYEAMMAHVSQYSGNRDIIDGPVFMLIDDKPSWLRNIDLIKDAVSILPDDSFPNRVWSSATRPPFKVMLGQHEEFMTQQVMGAHPTRFFTQLDSLINETRAYSSKEYGVVVDVGANLGMVSLFAAARGEHVVALEATTTTAQLLKSSCVLNGWCPAVAPNEIVPNNMNNNTRFAIFEDAVSDRDGLDITMRQDWQHSGKDKVRNAGANSMFAVEGEGSSTSTCKFEVKKSITLDSALKGLGLVPGSGNVELQQFKPANYISILKMDCEGCEPLAISGAPLLFKYNPPLSMLLEVFESRLVAAGSSPLKFLLHIEALGYNIFHQNTGQAISPVTERSVALAFGENGSSIDCVAILKSFGDHADVRE